MAGGPFPPQKGDPPLFHKGGVNPSLPLRLDTFLLRKEVDESAPFLRTQKVVVLINSKVNYTLFFPKGNKLIS